MAGCTASGPQSGQAQRLPGLSALVPSGADVFDAAVTAVSCTGPDDCVAGGSLAYAKIAANVGGLGLVSFVATERGGLWQPARALGGLAAQDTSPQGTSSQRGIQALSCSSPGSCVAAGDDGTSSGNSAFIVTERAGDWGTLIPVPGLSRLSANASIGASGLACWAVGRCVLAGSYGPAGSHDASGGHVFWASEVNGTWGPAVALADPPGLSAGANAGAAASVACTRDGTCAIAATYSGTAGVSRGVLATVADGKLGAVTPSGPQGMAAVSCPPAGGCTALGFVTDVVAFTLHGATWGQAPVPGLESASGLSCTGPGTCTAVGTANSAGNPPAVTSEVAGTWRPTVALPGMASLPGAQVMLVSCADTRDCVAAGQANSGSREAQGTYQVSTARPFIAVEKAGAWSAAQYVPGIAGLDGGRGSGLTAIACPAPGAWTGGGYYQGQATSAEQFMGFGNTPPFVIASAP
jgi:hypothetical protein